MIRVALIGCGAVAESGHLPTLRNHRDFEIAAACDVRPERAALLSRQAGDVPAFTDWRRALESQRFDAAVLALPPQNSVEVVIDCLRRGLAVLDEKPLAVTLAEGQRVAAAVAETRGVYQCGFVLRYGDWMRELGRLAAKIGTPSHIHVSIYDERLDPLDPEHLARIKGFLETSSAITHEGSHVVDYTALWNDAPWVCVEATARRTFPECPGPNLWHAEIQLADDSRIEIEIGWLLPELPASSIVMKGPHGSATFDPSTGRAMWQIGADNGEVNLPPARPEWMRQYDAFAQAVRRGAATVATIDDALRALEVTTASEASARSRRPVYHTLESVDVRK